MLKKENFLKYFFIAGLLALLVVNISNVPAGHDTYANEMMCPDDICNSVDPCGDGYDANDQSCDQDYCPDGYTPLSYNDSNGDGTDDACETTSYCPDGFTRTSGFDENGNGTDDACEEPDAEYCPDGSTVKAGADTDGDGSDDACDCDPADPGVSTRCVVFPPPPGGGEGGYCTGASSFVQTGYSATDCGGGTTQTTQYVCVDSPEYNETLSTSTPISVTGSIHYSYVAPYEISVSAYPLPSGSVGNVVSYSSDYTPDNFNPEFSVPSIRVSSSTEPTTRIDLVVSGGYYLYCRSDSPSSCGVFSAPPGSPGEYELIKSCNITTAGYIPYTLDEGPVVPEPPTPEPPIVDPVVDWCDNVDGVQDMVPDGYYREGESCFISDPNAVGQCGSADGSTVEPGSVDVGGYMSGQCSAGGASYLEEGTDSSGDPIYVWECIGGGGTDNCSALVDQCEDGMCETPVCGSAESATYDPNSNPGYNVGSSIGDNQDPACEVPDQASETITSISADSSGAGTIFWTCGVDGQSIGCSAQQEACPNGKTYCLADNQCWPPGSSDNPCSIQDAPDITLRVSPLINYNGSCTINWTLANNPNSNTLCRIYNIDKSTTEFLPEFNPSGTTGLYSFTGIKTDSRYRMECGQTNQANSTTTAEGICRVNFSSGEFN